MDRIQAYASLTTEPMTGNIALLTTYKPFFDRHGCLDDGCSDDEYPDIEPFTAINDRLNGTGRIFESMESVFETDIPGNTPASEAQAMLSAIAANAGVELIFGNAAFDNLG